VLGKRSLAGYALSADETLLDAVFTFSPGGDAIVAIGWSARAGRFYRRAQAEFHVIPDGDVGWVPLRSAPRMVGGRVANVLIRSVVLLRSWQLPGPTFIMLW